MKLILQLVMEIYNKYYAWVIKHAEEMLNIEGFISAEILQQADNEDQNKIVFTILFRLKTMEDVKNYFDHHSARMRDAGVSVFPNQFTANRRVFDLEISKVLCKNNVQ